MKKIIVPFDFTEVSLNALKYAFEQFPEEKIILLHIQDGIVDIKDPNFQKNEDITPAGLESRIRELLEISLDGHKALKDLDVVVEHGDIVPSIVNKTSELSAELLVMGTRDKYDFLDKWLGTISLGVIKQIKIPVYLVPRFANFQSYEKVIVAIDDLSAKAEIINSLKEWNSEHKAYMKFIHVKSDKDDDFRSESGTIVKNLLEASDLGFPFEISVLEGNGITESLLGNAYNFKADLLICLSSNQSIINTLFLESISKELILRSKIPVMYVNPVD